MAFAPGMSSWTGEMRLSSAVEILNRMTELGQPVSYRIGR